MKKAIVLLLALCVTGAVFAQGTFSVTAGGSVVLFNQDSNTSFDQDTAGDSLISFKGADADGMWGFNATFQDFLLGTTADGLGTLRNYEAWYKMGMVKVIVGKVRNGDFRTNLVEGWRGDYAIGRILNSQYGVLTEVTGLVEGLTIGYALPVDNTGADTEATYKMSRFGVAYTNDMFTVTSKVHLNLDAETTLFDFGVTYTGVENLTALAFVEYTQADPDPTIEFGVGAYYTMDKLYGGVEFEGQNTADLLWDVAAHADYQVTDPINAGMTVKYDSEEEYDVAANVTYDFGNGLDTSVDLGYQKTDELYWNLNLNYSISF